MLAKQFPHGAIVRAMLAVVLAIAGGATFARADDYTKCQDKLTVAESRLDRDTSRHGPYSRQARNDREHLEDARNWCTSHHIFQQQNRYYAPGPGRNPYGPYGYRAPY